MSKKPPGATAATSDKDVEPRSARTQKQKRADKQISTGGLTPTWWVPLALSLMVIGLLWVMTYYVSSGSYPIPGISMGNIAIGFAFILVGFVMLTRWK